MTVTVQDIHEYLRQIGGFYGVYVPELTYGQRRIDAAIIDVKKRWIRGFEIKISRADFLRDEKWHEYSQFCSSLSIACPEGLIEAREVQAPFGLVYVYREPVNPYTEKTHLRGKWVRKPRRFQRRDGLAWLYQYVRVIESELPRMNLAVERLSK